MCLSGTKHAMKSHDPLTRLNYMVALAEGPEVFDETKKELQILEVNILEVHELRLPNHKLCDICEQGGSNHWCNRCARHVCNDCSTERRILHSLDIDKHRICDLCVTMCDNSDLMTNLMLQYEIKKQIEKST